MPVAEVGKTYTYNGKKYVAQKEKNRMTCAECSLFRNRCVADGHVRMMRDGVAHTCVDGINRDGVIFKELKI